MGTSNPGAPASHGFLDLLRQSMLPTGALFEAYERYGIPGTNTGSNVVSGTLGMYAIALPVGSTITSVTFISGTTAGSGMTNQWAILTDSSRVVKAVSADGTSGAWSASTAKTFTFGTPFVTTYTGLYYIGLNVTGTPPNLIGSVTPAFVNLAEALTPVVCGTANTSLTTPLALAATTSAITASRFKPYFYIS